MNDGGSMTSITPEWHRAEGLTPYPDALAFMRARVDAIRLGNANGLVWLVEHPPLYTAGTSANRADLRSPDRFPTYDAGRGGQWTYHGPGQRTASAGVFVRCGRGEMVDAQA